VYGDSVACGLCHSEDPSSEGVQIVLGPRLGEISVTEVIAGEEIPRRLERDSGGSRSGSGGEHYLSRRTIYIEKDSEVMPYIVSGKGASPESPSVFLEDRNGDGVPLSAGNADLAEPGEEWVWLGWDDPNPRGGPSSGGAWERRARLPLDDQEERDREDLGKLECC